MNCSWLLISLQQIQISTCSRNSSAALFLWNCKWHDSIVYYSYITYNNIVLAWLDRKLILNWLILNSIQFLRWRMYSMYVLLYVLCCLNTMFFWAKYHINLYANTILIDIALKKILIKLNVITAISTNCWYVVGSTSYNVC